MNTFRLIGKISCAVILTWMTSCTNDEGPSIDDFFLNYEIPEMPVKSDIPVGAFYYNLGGTGLKNDIYNRLIGERDYTYETNPQYVQLCPHVRPVLGHYKMDLSDAETADLFQQHIEWANLAGINFFVMPAIAYDKSKASLMNDGHVNFVEYMAGRNPISENKIKWGKLKYALAVDMNNFCNNVSNTQLLENTEVDVNGVSQRLEQIYSYFKNLSKHFFMANSLYYEVERKPMLVLWNADKLYTKDSDLLYKNIRDTVYKYSEKEMYLVARQGAWTPAARFHNFWQGRVDACYVSNMYDQDDFPRSYMYPQYIDQNYKYNREYSWNNYSVDFIPAISPSYNKWMREGIKEYQYPIVDKDPTMFHTMCNVAKCNLGQRPMVLIDSFNNWEADMALEPSDPDYGNGYGMTYINMVKSEFKR